ncbi:hypothetical protein JT327_gp08 [Aeromonas phage LAh_7]|uniref:Uncharacterized protein n=1 Tax=Aeromonas phage LAh_7 TaxID=2591031 RepID=A0A514A0A8_9CAUD|nr:hypothetical protein JT327_gp08 [Aeromonas phage LAh_7]MBX7020135.1 hypothetical protein [Providencia rettgeri]QDH46704.1 hypothetical protein LAh7_8 [Aeromonas phage LAh_7]UHS65823.1 hypothetical protein Ah13B_08 [Aeromonas phage AhMtk13b]
MIYQDSPEYLECCQITAGYEAAFRRGDRAAVIAIVDAEIAYLEKLPPQTPMWCRPGNPWVDAGTMLNLARQRRARYDNTNARGDRWPYRG